MRKEKRMGFFVGVALALIIAYISTNIISNKIRSGGLCEISDGIAIGFFNAIIGSICINSTVKSIYDNEIKKISAKKKVMSQKNFFSGILIGVLLKIVLVVMLGAMISLAYMK